MLVIGLRHRAGEGAVAAAMTAVLRREGKEPRLERDVEPADWQTVITEGSEPVVAAIGGGLLGELAPRQTVRDLAVELGHSVVLATLADADAVNLVRLSLAAARAGRLHVAAVVLTGWPDPPDAEQLDARRLLSAGTGVDVRTLPESPSDRADTVRDWPLEDWLTPPPPPQPAEPPRRAPVAMTTTARREPSADVALEPYVAWESQPVGDPRATPRPRIMGAMLEIVAVEGPIVANRAYALYNRASGGKKLTTTARAPLSSALHWLAQERKVLVEADAVRLPDQPEVRVRELGDRVLEEVPLSEIAELMRRLELQDPDQLKRVVLTTYGLVRLTQRAEEYLDAALNQL